MNIWQKLRHRLFGTEYVLLIFHDGRYALCRAYKMGGYWYAAPYLPDTRCRLSPDGKAMGQMYIEGWEQVTGGIPRIGSEPELPLDFPKTGADSASIKQH